MTRNPKIKTFYNDKLNFTNLNSESPFISDKPKRAINYLIDCNLFHNFELIEDFIPFNKQDFYIAHHKDWVDDFFAGKGRLQRRNMLGIPWSEKFVESERYSNSSLYHAIKYSIQSPAQVCFSPTNGFHHAIPKMGALFCAFSGQVIASYKIYKEFGLSGCYIDLDGHYGNSIDNSYDFVPELSLAIPAEIGNINIDSEHKEYLKELSAKLSILRAFIKEERIHYIVFCHGADSHEWDYLGGGLTTDEWVECSRLVYNFVFDLQKETGKHIPLTLCLFGGYRKDDYDSVMSLHTADLVDCLNILCGQDIEFVPKVKPKGNI